MNTLLGVNRWKLRRRSKGYKGRDRIKFPPLSGSLSHAKLKAQRPMRRMGRRLYDLAKLNPKAKGVKPEKFADARLARELAQRGFVKVQVA